MICIEGNFFFLFYLMMAEETGDIQKGFCVACSISISLSILFFFFINEYVQSLRDIGSRYFTLAGASFQKCGLVTFGLYEGGLKDPWQ